MFVWESGDLSIDDGVSALADSADARRSSIPRKNSTLWFGKAIPRVWLSAGETVAVEGASARGGASSVATPWRDLSAARAAPSFSIWPLSADATTSLSCRSCSSAFVVVPSDAS